MQDLPEKSTLLDALARFLDVEVRGAVQDPALAFRVRIASHLAQVVAREIRGEDAHDLAELQRLEKLLDRTMGPTAIRREDRHLQMKQMNRTLAKAIRAGTLDARERTEAHAHVKATLIDKLSVIQPRFDTKADIGD